MPQVSINQYFSSSQAYFIPVDKYSSSSINDLESPSNDVRAIKEVLEKYHGFTSFDIRDRHDNVKQNAGVDVASPTSLEILSFLSSIDVEETGRIIIYFGCHGIAIDSEGEPEGYLLAADAQPGEWDTFLKMSDIFKVLNNLKCKHLFLILDCCYAGAFRWANRTRGIICDVPKNIYFERFRQYATNKAWQVLTSSAHDQKAVDTLRLGKREGDDKGMLSPFAEVLVKALKDGSADLSFGNAPPDGIITATELSFYLQNRIFERLYNAGIKGNKRQLPMLFPIIDASKDQHGKGEFFFINPSMKDGIADLKSVTKTNPYKGLDSYNIGDASIFYGRQRVLDGWHDGAGKNIGLIEAAQQYNLIVLAGPSGIGKSSLAKAGLLAYYKKSQTVHEIRPGKTPMTSNRSLLNKLKASEEREVLLVDQYEELITTSTEESERTDFEMELLGLVSRHLVVITIRTDFESQFRESALLNIEKENAGKYRFIVPPFLREEIEEIVVQPAVQEVLEFKGIGNNGKSSDKFIDRIVDDAYQNPGSLPLLSMALSEIYENRDGNNLLEEVYDKFGGLSGILDRKATNEYKKLSGDSVSETFFRYLIYRMISFESGRISKKRIYTHIERLTENDELEFDNAGKTARFKSIAGNLVSAGLLKTDVDEKNQPFIEPSHDALLRSWGILAEWLKRRNNVLNTNIQEEIQLLKSVSDISSRFASASVEEQKGYLDSWSKHPKLLQVKDQIGDQLNKAENAFVSKAYARKIRSKRVTVSAVTITFVLLTAAAIFLFVLKNAADNNLKSYQIARFKENVQNGIVYMEAKEHRLAKIQFSNAYNIYKQLSADPTIRKEVSRTGFQSYVEAFKLDK
ncbi:hypothetical protein F0L74_21655 [Chitinophaga agrisoli]|uniref:Caspase domain-containing protein n=1 Tax=Chitinophaga agrisoli TaxID=2607653 RepID=A0A5B2VGX3_9BACT|nr:caspase family protein [Chitinophaga agrisoli]KAA2238823.1 hypothetical protein F0L74_21655 [Chitinophaga agrisoli]